MGEPASAHEKTAQNADEVAMGRPTAPKDIDARSDAQIAVGQPATSVGEPSTATFADSAGCRKRTRLLLRSGRRRPKRHTRINAILASCQRSTLAAYNDGTMFSVA
jgi:hypothetical protein